MANLVGLKAALEENLDYLKGLLWKEVNVVLDDVFAAKPSPSYEMPKSFFCPIMHQPMVDPVTAPSGYTFERSAIVMHLRDNRWDPITKEPLSVDQLVPNRALLDAIEEFFRQQERSTECASPSIRPISPNFASGSENPDLSPNWLRECPIKLLKVILQIIPSGVITSTDGSYHYIEEIAAQRLGSKAYQEVLSRAKLTNLSLTKMSLTDEDAKALSQALKRNTSLKNLDLSGNDIGAEGARALADALVRNTSLIVLNLDTGSMGRETKVSIGRALERNSQRSNSGAPLSPRLQILPKRTTLLSPKTVTHSAYRTKASASAKPVPKIVVPKHAPPPYRVIAGATSPVFAKRAVVNPYGAVKNVAPMPDLKHLSPAISIFDEKDWETDFEMKIGDAPSLNTQEIIPILQQHASLPIKDDVGVTFLTIPKGLSFNTLIQLALKKNVPLGHIWTRIPQDIDDTPVGKTYRVVITNNVLKDGIGIDVDDQVKLLARLECRMPTLLEAATLLVTAYVSSKRRLYHNDPDIYTRCKEEIDSWQVVTCFTSERFSEGLYAHIDNFDESNYGVGALRKIE